MWALRMVISKVLRNTQHKLADHLGPKYIHEQLYNEGTVVEPRSDSGGTTKPLVLLAVGSLETHCTVEFCSAPGLE